MADIGKTVKEIWEQSMKAVNKAATNIATSTKQKVDEMNIVTRRKELQNQLGLRLYELWQAGEDVPETLKATLEEMRDLEVKLQELRESKTTAPEDEKSAAPRHRCTRRTRALFQMCPNTTRRWR